MRNLRGAVYSNPVGRGSIMRRPTGMGFDWSALANVFNVAATDASALIRQTQGGPQIVATSLQPGAYPPGTYPAQTSLLPAASSNTLILLAGVGIIVAVLMRKK